MSNRILECRTYVKKILIIFIYLSSIGATAFGKGCKCSIVDEWPKKYVVNHHHLGLPAPLDYQLTITQLTTTQLLTHRLSTHDYSTHDSFTRLPVKTARLFLT